MSSWPLPEQDSPLRLVLCDARFPLRFIFTQCSLQRALHRDRYGPYTSRVLKESPGAAMGREECVSVSVREQASETSEKIRRGKSGKRSRHLQVCSV